MGSVTSLRRYVVKGTLFNVVATRNIFTVQQELQDIDEEMDVAKGYLDGIYEAIRQITTTNCTTTTVQIETRSGTSWIGGDEASFVWQGLASGDQIANLVAAVLIGKVAGHKGMGRKFFSGLAESQVDGNSATAGALVYLATALVAYISPFVSDNGSVVTPGLIMKDGNFHPFTSGVISSLLGSMRRRKPGLGI